MTALLSIFRRQFLRRYPALRRVEGNYLRPTSGPDIVCLPRSGGGQVAGRRDRQRARRPRASPNPATRRGCARWRQCDDAVTPLSHPSRPRPGVPRGISSPPSTLRVNAVIAPAMTPITCGAGVGTGRALAGSAPPGVLMCHPQVAKPASPTCARRWHPPPGQ